MDSLQIYVELGKKEGKAFLRGGVIPLMHKMDTTKEKYCYCHFKVFFRSIITLDDLHLAINSDRETSLTFVECFLVVNIMLIYAKIFLLTKMLRSLQIMNLKIFCVACRHSLQKFAYKIGTDVDIATERNGKKYHLNGFLREPFLDSKAKSTRIWSVECGGRRLVSFNKEPRDLHINWLSC